MAAGQASPSGFSYAQAAKGRSPAIMAQQPQSKPTQGAGTPATSTFSELLPAGNWADAVEESTSGKKTEASPAVQDVEKLEEAKVTAVDRARTEDKIQTAESGTSSPDLLASTSTTTKDDESSPAMTGPSSETTWETKSQTSAQASEPSWIAERTARHAAASQKAESAAKAETTSKAEKKAKEVSLPAPAPPSFQPAPPPPVNIWQKRAEEAKAKVVTPPLPLKATPSAPVESSTGAKENQHPRADSKKKATSLGNSQQSTESANTPSTESRRAQKSHDVRINNLQQHGTKAMSRESESPLATRNASSRSSPPAVPNTQSLVKDEGSWPTPDLAPNADRKDVVGKESAEKPGEDDSQAGKRKKPEWEKMVVTPTIRWDQNAQNARGHDGRRPPGAERGRGGLRGRGSLRGGANGVSSTDRPTQRSIVDDTTSSATPRSRTYGDREASSPSKPPRTASQTTVGSTVETAAEQNEKPSVLDQHVSAVDGAKGIEHVPEQNPDTGAWSTQAYIPRTASPVKVNGASGASHDEERIPASIPRRTSIGTQTENGMPAGSLARDGPPIRMVPSGNGKENRNLENFKDGSYHGTTRGNGKPRGGRGRGGAQRDFVNSQPSSHTNGDFAGAPAFGVPPSPSGYHNSRGNHFSSPSQSGRGGWTPRGNPRAGSLAMEGYAYGRFQGPYGQSQPPHVQTYMPPGYDYNGYPIAVMPYQASMEHVYIVGMVSMQLEYYFSIDNLLKDMFLRKNMDSQGFVFLDVVGNFNRMKHLTPSRDILKEACIESPSVETRMGEDGKERVRRREGYEQFILPMDQREPGAQTEGPKHLQPLERLQIPTWHPAHQRGPQSAALPGMRYDRRSYDPGFHVNGMAPQFASYTPAQEGVHGNGANGEDVRGRPVKSPVQSTAPNVSKDLPIDGQRDIEPDAFPDDQVSSLTLIVKVKKTVPFHTSASRTFSNGSIDSRSIHAELATTNGTQTPPSTSTDAAANGTEGSRASSSHRAMTERGAAPDMTFFWLKDQQAPSETLPHDVTSEPYAHLRRKALEQRSHAATGTCPYDLDVLYQFWSHFLLRNFNSGMYTEFQHYANEDAKTRHNVSGLQNLIKFYDQALLSANAIRDRVAKDYGKLVNDEPAELDGAAFKQLRSAWRNGAMNLKNRKKMIDVLSPAVRARLDQTNGDVTSPMS
ncbi:hypothetical protein LTR62_002006 [Meristemomyces frigidus]|uniref:HTH La-type RNA-binding domain-containing protein n=1 Tax=Meristemomyces frigidus TaxID=1508187 RepID=A0AAN7TL53_9PEZI|nr:hypothetical protein LTR62_002006 [Meristemomyces frigidus]